MPEMNDRNESNNRGAISVHDLALRSRSHAEISGVSDVVSFDETSVCLETSMGEMMIEGDGIRVSTLDTEKGRIVIDGRINAIYYNTDTAEKKCGFFGKIFG